MHFPTYLPRVLTLVLALTLALTAAAAPANAAAPDVTLADTGLLRDDGQTALLEIVVTCATSGNLNASAAIQQPSGRSVASGSGWTLGQCSADDTVHLFVPVESDYAAFKSGPASVRARVSFYTPNTWESHYEELSGTVRMNK
ncbi:MAG TPA: hypothetical protein VGR08_14170 [Thermomicrobiales bacterium]|nr:hypothetical protein [Thermomicrobiales bacterium]